LGQKFDDLLERRGVKGPQRDQMRALPPEAKWTLVCQEAKTQQAADVVMSPENAAKLTGDAHSSHVQFDQVAVLLASQPVRWVEAYISAGGLRHLLNMLVNRVRTMQSGEKLDGAAVEAICSGIRCLKAVMNAQLELSIECVNETKGVAGTLLVCVQLVPPRLAASLLEMLAAVAVATDRGHRAIRKPLITSSFLTYVAKTLLPNSAVGGAQMQIAAMTFLNAVLSGYGDADKRGEFVAALKTAGVLAVVADLRNTFANDDTTLVVHMQMQLDIIATALADNDDDVSSAATASGSDPASVSASPQRALPQPGASSANTTSNSSSTLRLQAAGVAPAQKGVAPLDEKKGVSLKRRPHKERAAGAAGAAALESYELTIDRKDGPEALARQLGESLRGTAVAKALPKLIKALGSMRTEGPMATATWGLLAAFVQVLSFMPEPADGVAAPGELVNAAAEALAEEFAVKLKGNVQPQLPPPPLPAEIGADQSALVGELNGRVAELEEALQTARDVNERLKADLEDLQLQKARQDEENVAWQMQQHEQSEALKRQYAETEEKLSQSTAALRSITNSKRERSDAMSSPRGERPEHEIAALKAEVATLRAELATNKLEQQQDVVGTVRKPQRAAPVASSVDDSGGSSVSAEALAAAVASAAAAAASEAAQLRSRIAELEKQLADAVIAVAEKPSSTGSSVAVDNDDIAPITGGPPPPPMMGGGGGGGASSEDAPITGGPPPPPGLMGGGGGSDDAPITGGPPPPPPMMGGGGPPPPPMPGVAPPPMPGKKAEAPEKKKADVKPGTKMKAFNWTKIPPRKVDGSVWSKLDDTKVKLDHKALEELFGVLGDGAAKPAKAAAPKGEGGKEAVISVLDPRRSQNLTIMLSRFKGMTFVQLRKAIESLDTTVLTPDNLKALVTAVPTAEEIELLKEHLDTPPERLGKADQYLIEMSRVPRLEERLESILFYGQFQSRFVVAQQEVHVLRTACSEVRDSKRLQALLEYILAIGNYVNGSTFRGAAFGFKLDSLLKLLEVKSNDGRASLMHYVVDTLERQAALTPLLDFADEMPSVSAAARVQPLSQVTADLAKLGSGLVNIEKEVTQIDDANDRFVAMMTKFHAVAATKVAGLREAHSKMGESFKELLKFFCEDTTETTENFFGLLQRFVSAFAQARHEKKIWEQQLVAAEQSAQRMQKLGVKGKPMPGVAAGGPAAPGAINPFAGVEKGSLDSMIQSLKSGADNRLHRKTSNLNTSSNAVPPAPAAVLAQAALKKSPGPKK
jgi:hypothetical protein